MVGFTRGKILMNDTCCNVDVHKTFVIQNCGVKIDGEFVYITDDMVLFGRSNPWRTVDLKNDDIRSHNILCDKIIERHKTLSDKNMPVICNVEDGKYKEEVISSVSMHKEEG